MGQECIPPLWPENEEAFLLYKEVAGQWIMGPMGPVAINHQALYWAMERLNIRSQEVFDRVNQVFQMVRKTLTEKIERRTL